MNNSYVKKVQQQQMDKYTTPKKKTYTMDMLTKGDLSSNPKTSADTEEKIREIGRALKAVVQGHYLGMPTPVIAGGAVRDVIFGKRPKDYDVFVSTLHWPEEDREDNLLVFGQLVLQELKKSSPETFSSLITERLERVTADSGENKEYSDETTGEEFIVYENSYDDAMENVEQWENIQFIGRPNDKLSKGLILEFVEESFDYPLVKAFYDPSTGDFVVSDEFRLCLDSGVVTARDDRTFNRVQRFWLWTKSHGKIGFEINDERKSKPKTRTFDLESNSTHNAMFRYNILPIAPF